MKKLFKKIFVWTYIKIHSILIRISIALYSTEIEILKANPDNLSEKDKKTTRNLHRNRLLEKFYSGQTDEVYVQDYYELLKKADNFLKKSTPHKMAVAADRHGMIYGEKDKYGRRYDHFGFFDSKHKHSGKTIGEVLELDFEERRTKDDDYELLYIFNNTPIEVGLAKIFDVVKETEKKDVDFEYEVHDIFQKSKSFIFPITVNRENENITNKIEQLTETLHIKKIGFEYRQLEFFIPLKFDTIKINEEDDIFKELSNINNVFVKGDYGTIIGFNILKFIKKILYNDTHEVWKFEGIEMDNLK